MASNIVLKTYKGGTVTPQNDAIVQEAAIPSNGIFKGCNISYARGNVLRVSSGFGMIKGRFFEIYDCEVDVRLAEGAARLYGRLYVHMDLSNTDEPVQLLTVAAEELPELEADSDVNYNNSTYDLELATFRVTSSEISQLEMTFQKIDAGSGGGGGGGGKENISRSTEYNVGDMTRCVNAPGWVTLICVQAGETAMTVPSGYARIERIGDTIVDGTCVFEARNIIAELDDALSDIEGLQEDVENIQSRLSSSDGLVTKLMSLEAYAALASYSDNTMYYCYYASEPGKIVRIYLGENRVYSDGVDVTFQIDTGEAETVHVDDRADALLSAPIAEMEDYIFVGWRRDTEANSRVLSNCIVEQDTNFTLYAVFRRDIEIAMYPNGGTLAEGKEESTIETSCYYNNGNAASPEVTIPKCPYERDGMSFCGWSCNGTRYKPGEKHSFNDDMFIVPEWVTTVYDFPYTGNYAPFTIPEDGIYEFEVWGGAGGDAKRNDIVGAGGKGGHAKGYKRMTKGQVLYIFNGGKPSANNPTIGGSNGGGRGNTYSSNNHVGAGGGGATHIATKSGEIGTNYGITYNNRDTLLIVAGGGGGGAIEGGTTPKAGGDGGGERGGNGSAGVLGGRQISTGSSESVGFGTGGSYGSSSSNYSYSGGGAGYFGGNYDANGDSAAGGSGYVGGVPAFTYNKKYYANLNEAGINEGNGYSFIRYVECV